MSIELQQIINSRIAVSFVSLIGRVTPPRIGYPICDIIADWIATRRDSKLTQAVRANQWVVRGANLEKEALDKAIRETFHNNAHNLYDLYHYIQSPEAAQRMISLNPVARELFEQPEFGARGLVIAGLHLSNFDFILQSMSRRGLKAVVLTIPDPQGGRRAEYEIRRKTGMNVVPVSVSALRQAIKHLEQGGMVLTGIDRPISDPRFHPKFFSCPASLPTHYSYIASKARVPVVIMAAIQQADGKYHVMNSEPMEMEQYSDHATGNLQNAERVLRRAEAFIRLAPQQWNMFLPVWPEMLEKVPR